MHIDINFKMLVHLVPEDNQESIVCTKGFFSFR